jgi:hypothetical protein
MTPFAFICGLPVFGEIWCLSFSSGLLVTMCETAVSWFCAGWDFLWFSEACPCTCGDVSWSRTWRVFFHILYPLHYSAVIDTGHVVVWATDSTEGAQHSNPQDWNLFSLPWKPQIWINVCQTLKWASWPCLTKYLTYLTSDCQFIIGTVL